MLMFDEFSPSTFSTKGKKITLCPLQPKISSYIVKCSMQVDVFCYNLIGRFTKGNISESTFE